MCKFLETGQKVKFVQRLTQKSTSQNFLVFFFEIYVSNYPRNNWKNLHLLHADVIHGSSFIHFPPVFTTFHLIRFVPPHMGLPGFLGSSFKFVKPNRQKKNGRLLGRIEDSILQGPGQTQGSGQKISGWGEGVILILLQTKPFGRL